MRGIFVGVRFVQAVVHILLLQFNCTLLGEQLSNFFGVNGERVVHVEAAFHEMCFKRWQSCL